MVLKVWNDMDNLDGSRPDSLTVTMTGSNGMTATATLNAANNWTHEETDLPLYDDGGNLVTYTWSEQSVAGYTASTQASGNTTVFTNTHIPELVSTTVIKVWDDNDNAANLRPATLRVTLSNGESYTLSEANGWTVTVEDLPKYVNGTEVAYTWSEQSVLGYTSSVATSGNVTTFTNTYRLVTPPTTPPGGNNPPRTPNETPEEPLEVIEDYNTALGIEVMINHVGDCFD